MGLHRKYYFGVILIWIYLQHSCEAAIAGGLLIAGGSIVIGAGLHWGRCYFEECCTDKWTRPNKTFVKEGLDNSFKKFLYGQHLVTNIVPKVVRNHIKDENPKKALVLSFHGWTGCGKTFVSNIIAEYIYREGMQSKYVHVTISSEHYPDPNKLEIYKKELRQLIKDKTKECGRSLFIFDEMDKMPSGLSDVLKPYLDFHHRVDGIDFRKNIFIFLNNIGGDQISKVTLNNFKSGAAREDITSSSMEYILSVTSLKLDGGFKDANLVLSALIDFYLPFLPLERIHVKQCASAEINRRPHLLDRQEKKEIVEKVANEIQYYPAGEAIFAISGCKLVAKKVDMFF